MSTTDSILDIDNPELEDAIFEMIIGEIAKVRTVTPGKVTSYDPATQRATVQPILRGRYVDEDSLEIVTTRPPLLSHVPVWWPGSNASTLYAPLEAGDDVMLIISDRALDEWKASDNSDLTPQDMRRFDLTDAVALPGRKSLPTGLGGKVFFGEPSLTGARFVIDDGKVALGASGVEALEQINDALDSWASTLTELLAVTTTITTNGASSPATPVTNGTLAVTWATGFNVATLTTRLAQLNAAIAALSALRGSL